eukprot:TRINITY_DN2490_c0_g1_i2.p1 TRINITY_DN2490_c0_g1~~TRINITY_DN2490_c0_g1_i2.p1  ORF type:complete len:118 (+),score=27.91 TRINITY_DN2490_c0_g1_i2:102-455(+)
MAEDYPAPFSFETKSEVTGTATHVLLVNALWDYTQFRSTAQIPATHTGNFAAVPEPTALFGAGAVPPNPYVGNMVSLKVANRFLMYAGKLIHKHGGNKGDILGTLRVGDVKLRLVVM